MTLLKEEWPDELVVGMGRGAIITGSHVKRYHAIIDDGVIVSHRETVCRIDPAEVDAVLPTKAEMLSQLSDEIELRKATARLNTELDAQLAAARTKAERDAATVDEQAARLQQLTDQLATSDRELKEERVAHSNTKQELESARAAVADGADTGPA